MSEELKQPEARAISQNDRSGIEPLITHADRCWNAEREVADRISREQHLTVTVLIAMIGLGLFQFDWIGYLIRSGGDPFSAMRWLIGLTLLGSLFYLVVALFKLVSRDRFPTASEQLDLPNDLLADPVSRSEAENQIETFASTYRAYKELRRQNSDKLDRIRSGNTAFIIALVFAVAAIIIYSVFVIATDTTP